MSDEVAKIAAGLTEAQRRAVIAFSDHWQAGPNMAFSIVDEIAGLRNAGILERRFGDDGPPQVSVSESEDMVSVKMLACWFFRLTPLGAAVRAHMEADHESE